MGTCTNAISPNAPLHPFFQRGTPAIQSFSVNTAATIIPSQAFFGASPTGDPCYITAGSTPPDATSALTFLASASADGMTYREYGSYDKNFAYQSPYGSTNPDMFTTVVPNSTLAWSNYGRMYSNAAISARLTGSAPLLATTEWADLAGTPVFSYKCTARRNDKIVADPNKQSTASTSCMSVWLLVLSALAVAVMC